MNSKLYECNRGSDEGATIVRTSLYNEIGATEGLLRFNHLV
jgi:hypothetical protein